MRCVTEATRCGFSLFCCSFVLRLCIAVVGGGKQKDGGGPSQGLGRAGKAAPWGTSVVKGSWGTSRWAVIEQQGQEGPAVIPEFARWTKPVSLQQAAAWAADDQAKTPHTMIMVN